VEIAQTIPLLAPLADIETFAPGHENESFVILGLAKFTVPFATGYAFR